MKLTDKDRDFLALLQRPPDRGKGWRSVSNVVWPLVDAFPHAGLLERDKQNMRVRLTSKGAVVAEYLA